MKNLDNFSTMEWALAMLFIALLVLLAELTLLSGCTPNTEQEQQAEIKLKTKQHLVAQEAYQTKFKDALQAIHPDLPIETRCKYITDLMEPPTYDCLNNSFNSGIECRRRRMETQTMCEVMLKNEN